MKNERIYLDDIAYIDTYIADETENYTRRAILIIPGGAYYNVVSGREGESVAFEFLAHGFNAFVLNYAVNRAKTFPAQLIEASCAIKHIKDNYEKYGIDPEEIYAVGFSAGGHLAASLATMWDKKEIYDAIDMPYGYNKPKGVILIYPVISAVSEYSSMFSIKNLLGTDEPTCEQLKAVSIELNVKETAVPLFIVHSASDTTVPVENSFLIAEAYSKLKIPFEMHIYPTGAHGFSLGNDITSKGRTDLLQREKWIDKAVSWIKDYISEK
ncbi:MAG: alpha/beta hydrolase [Ruminococcaceae bacterium]|nr:alpha/beta hydrolase [Oscillospiraceae bacterium]